MYRISIVTPTYNRLDRLQRLIAALEQQTFPLDCFEMVVVSDGSHDGTNDYLRNLQTPLNLKPIFQENQGEAPARNTGIDHATGDIVLFQDDDLAPIPTLIEEHLRVHDTHDEEVVVIAPLVTPPDFDMLPWVLWEQWMLEKQYAAMADGAWEPTPRQFFTGNASVPRHHLVAVGGFDTALRRSEDIELGYRLAARGLKFVFHPQAIGYHYAERSWQSWLNTPLTRGRNDAVYAREKGHDWVLPVAFREYRTRHPLVKGLTRACLNRPKPTQLATTVLKRIAETAHKRQPAVTRVAYSGIFNLLYYQGIAEIIGGRAPFFAGVKQTS